MWWISLLSSKYVWTPISIPFIQSHDLLFNIKAIIPLYAALFLVCKPNNLIVLKLQSFIVLGNSSLPLIQSYTCFTSKAYLVSFAPPYSSPNTPHQNHCFIFSFMDEFSNSLSNKVQITASGISWVEYGISVSYTHLRAHET